MMNEYLFQGGDHPEVTPFYSYIVNFLKNHYNFNFSFIDLGCGVSFGLEKRLMEYFANLRGGDSCYCIDRTNPSQVGFEIPDFVNFTCCSVEQEIKINKQFDIVYFSELIEHIDYTDMLLDNCRNLLKDDGFLICTVPNLSSLYSRLELLFGFQPHLLEVSNENAWIGQGKFGMLNNSTGKPLHHIRGLTYRAMKELLKFHGFDVLITKGYNGRPFRFIKNPSFASDVLFICKKQIEE